MKFPKIPIHKSNQIEDEGAIEIAEALKFNNTLTDLPLRVRLAFFHQEIQFFKTHKVQ